MRQGTFGARTKAIHCRRVVEMTLIRTHQNRSSVFTSFSPSTSWSASYARCQERNQLPPKAKYHTETAPNIQISMEFHRYLNNPAHNLCIIVERVRTCVDRIAQPRRYLEFDEPIEQRVTHG